MTNNTDPAGLSSSPQQYRVIADRDKGDQPVYDDVQTHTDRVTVEQYGQPTEHIVRLERAVSTTDRSDLTRDQFSNDEAYYLATGQRLSPHLPTREQVAEVIGTATATYWESPESKLLSEQIADAVLALIQKGADRG